MILLFQKAGMRSKTQFYCWKSWRGFFALFEAFFVFEWYLDYTLLEHSKKQEICTCNLRFDRAWFSNYLRTCRYPITLGWLRCWEILLHIQMDKLEWRFYYNQMEIRDEFGGGGPPNFLYFWYPLPPLFYCIFKKEFLKIFEICTFDTSNFFPKISQNFQEICEIFPTISKSKK